MLVGYYGEQNVTIDSVVVMGKNNLKGAQNAYCGMFVGRGKAWGGSVTIDNSIFVCTDPATTSLKNGWAGAARDAWGAYGKVNVNNSYAVNLPAENIEIAFAGSNDTNSNYVGTNIYATGSLDREYTWITVNNVKTPVTYKSTGLASFYANIVDRDVAVSDMFDNAMGLPEDAWTTWKFQAPVPSAFTAKNAKYLSEMITFGESFGDIVLIGSPEELDRYAQDYANGSKFDAKLIADVYYNNIYTVNEAVDAIASSLVGGERHGS
jgi:hypothetical protein